MLNSNLTFIFFRLFNFFIIVFIIGYIFKRFLKRAILNQIKNRQKHFESLEEEYKKLNNNFHQIEEEKKESQFFAEDFKKKLHKWQVGFKLEQEAKHRAYESIESGIQQSYLVKQKNITLQYLASKTLLKAVANAQDVLSKKFNDAEICKYQDKLIEFIKKEL